jgi:outer membrane protein assembly factor BamD
MYLKNIAFLIAGLQLTGCALFKEPRDETKNWTPQQIQTAAKTALNEGDYETSIKYYEILEARYPLGTFAQQAQLDMIYAYYKFEEAESAIAAAERFIKLYPRHPKVDYAYYMRGLAHFNENFGLIERYLPLNLSERDQAATRRSFQNFAELLKLFPESTYADDAKQRMVYLRNQLAQYELNVADFYMRRGAYLAAANRAQYVAQHFNKTPAVPDALTILAKAYKKMGYEDLAEDTLKVLKLNHSNYAEIAAEIRETPPLTAELAPLKPR